MDYLGLALAILKLVNLIMGYVDREKAKQDGRNEIIAATLADIAVKAGIQKNIREKIDAMSAEEVDAELRDLEPK